MLSFALLVILCLHFCSLGGRFLEEPGGEVALAGVGYDDDDELARALGVRRDLPGCPERRARRNAREDARATREVPRRRSRVLGLNLDYFVDELRVVDAGYQARVDALDLVGAGLAA